MPLFILFELLNVNGNNFKTSENSHLCNLLFSQVTSFSFSFLPEQATEPGIML